MRINDTIYITVHGSDSIFLMPAFHVTILAMPYYTKHLFCFKVGIISFHK